MIRHPRKFFAWLLLFCIISTDAFANQKLTLILDWFVNPNHAPIFVAQEQGFFKKNGLDVEIITPADPSDPPKWVAIGKGDIAIDYQPHVLMEIARGLPVKQLGTLIDQPLNCLVVLKSSHIQQVSELRGKRIAYAAPEIDLAILKVMLQKAGLSLQDVTTINVHYDLVKALLSQKVEAAIGMMRNYELIQLEMLKKPGKPFFPENYGVPAYSELVFIVNEKQKQDERHQRFLKALQEARQYLLLYPEKSWQQFAAHHSELNTPLNKKAWLENLNKFPADFNVINKMQCEKLAFFLKGELNVNTKNACKN